MTAPYRPPSDRNSAAISRQRIRAVENADTLGTDGYSTFYDLDFWCEDGSQPYGLGYFTSSNEVEVSEAMSLVNFQVVANGVWGTGPGGIGTGVGYYLALANWFGMLSAFNGLYYSVDNTPIGTGWCWDSSANAFEWVQFRVSATLPLPPAPDLTVGPPYYIWGWLEAVLQNGTIVGPTNPFTWATGDTIMGGQLHLQKVPRETIDWT